LSKGQAGIQFFFLEPSEIGISSGGEVSNLKTYIEGVWIYLGRTDSSLYLYKNAYHSTAHKRSKVNRESSSVFHITFHGFFYCVRQCTCQHVAPRTKIIKNI